MRCGPGSVQLIAQPSRNLYLQFGPPSSLPRATRLINKSIVRFTPSLRLFSITPPPFNKAKVVTVARRVARPLACVAHMRKRRRWKKQKKKKELGRRRPEQHRRVRDCCLRNWGSLVQVGRNFSRGFLATSSKSGAHRHPVLPRSPDPIRRYARRRKFISCTRSSPSSSVRMRDCAHELRRRRREVSRVVVEKRKGRLDGVTELNSAWKVDLTITNHASDVAYTRWLMLIYRHEFSFDPRWE